MRHISKEGFFEAAHVLSNYEGPCSNLHGHSYYYMVEIASKNTHGGMVLDYNSIKGTIDRYDHATIFASPEDRDSFENALYQLATTHRKRTVVMSEGRPTAENISRDIALAIRSCVPDAEYIRVHIKETRSSEATYEC